MSSCGKYIFTLKKKGLLEVYEKYRKTFTRSVAPIAVLEFDRRSSHNDAYSLELFSINENKIAIFVHIDQDCKRQSVLSFEFLSSKNSITQKGVVDIKSGKYNSFLKGLTAVEIPSNPAQLYLIGTEFETKKPKTLLIRVEKSTLEMMFDENWPLENENYNSGQITGCWIYKWLKVPGSQN